MGILFYLLCINLPQGWSPIGDNYRDGIDEALKNLGVNRNVLEKEQKDELTTLRKKLSGLPDGLFKEITEAALEGKTLSGDALYSNKNLVREIDQERGGEVLVQLKANQKTTLEEATRRLNQSAPPFYTQTQNSATDA